MLVSNLGNTINVALSRLTFDYSEIESSYKFFTGTDADIDLAFSSACANDNAINELTTFEFVLDLERELSNIRNAKNVVEYSLMARELERRLFEMFAIRNQVLEGRYIRLTATKKQFEDLAERFENTRDSGKKRVAIRKLIANI